MFLRISTKRGAQAPVDLEAVALANGSLKVKNPKGNDLFTDLYRSAHALGLTFRYRF